MEEMPIAVYAKHKYFAVSLEQTAKVKNALSSHLAWTVGHSLCSSLLSSLWQGTRI